MTIDKIAKNGSLWGCLIFFMRKICFVVAVLVGLWLGASGVAKGDYFSSFEQNSGALWRFVSIGQFVPSEGDYLLADVKKGTGYLINNESGRFTAFPLLSGQHRYVYYIGRYYYAATPEQKWVVKEMNIQHDRITFSESGRFLRLYADGETYTSYGIHGHAYFETMIEQDSKFQSMGCLLVSDEVMDVLVESFYANEDGMRVLTFST